MFTGLIEGTGTLLRIDQRGPDAQMVIRPNRVMESLQLGESIAVDGACLTVVSFHGSEFTVDVSAETLHRTTLGRKTSGVQVNLERALRMGDRLGGHLVSGHVDGIGILKDRAAEGRSWRLSFQVPRELTRHVIEKGSIAVNGISLTVNGCGDTHFHVNIVPHTAKETTIPRLRIGEEVNVETDLVGKYVEKLVACWGGQGSPGRERASVDVDFLKEHGFL